VKAKERRNGNAPADVRHVEHLLDDCEVGLDVAYSLLSRITVGPSVGDELDQLRRELAACGWRCLAAAGLIRRTFDCAYMSRIGTLIRTIETPEPAIGFRTWRVYGTDRLLSPVSRDHRMRDHWMPGESFAAYCEALGDGCPHCDCVCGVYAFRDLRHLPSPQPLHVTGAVALWGRIVEHELGFRAEHARPVALCEGYYAQQIADAYDLPVVSRDGLERGAPGRAPGLGPFQDLPARFPRNGADRQHRSAGLSP
jgi:hypothetical protein